MGVRIPSISLSVIKIHQGRPRRLDSHYIIKHIQEEY